MERARRTRDIEAQSDDGRSEEAGRRASFNLASRKEEIRSGSNALSSVDASSGCIVSRAASQMKSPGDFLYPGRYTLYARR